MNRNSLVRAVKTAIDAVVLACAYSMAYGIRFEGRIPADDVELMVYSFPYVLALKQLFLVAHRVPSLTWRYTSLLEARRLLIALVGASTLLLAIKYLGQYWSRHSLTPFYVAIPLGVLLIDLLLSLAGMIGVRVMVRSFGERASRTGAKNRRETRTPTIFIGAGQVGAMVAKEVAGGTDLGIRPIGFVDDDARKVGQLIHGLRVLGTTADLGRIVSERGVRQALITIGQLSGPIVRRVSALCAERKIPTKMIAGIGEMVEGRVGLSAIRDVAIEDLLRRDPVKLDDRAISENLKGVTVLVTGAGGSIGSELCREICRFGPSTLILAEQAENCLFAINRELLCRFPHLNIAPCVADICDKKRMTQIFSRWQPAVVFHAAAHKHVPLMEENAGEAIKNNVFGSCHLADMAHANGVRQFVLISTDKAVKPSSVMGVSKRIAEVYVQALSQRSRTKFVTVRFGNVLGSAGSVIPIFKEQIAKGGPVTVTHPAMRRYFMTISEACQLVLQAASMGRGGEIFILDMGEQIRILDLARDLIQLSGLALEDIEIKFTGVRPGEKLSEELSLTAELVHRTRHPKILIGQRVVQNWRAVRAKIRSLLKVANSSEPSRIFAKLKEIVPEYQPDYSAPSCIAGEGQDTKYGLQPLLPDQDSTRKEHIGTAVMPVVG
jgi:FlaA1/EpsC-like NDP-sugar epimerase